MIPIKFYTGNSNKLTSTNFDAGSFIYTPDEGNLYTTNSDKSLTKINDIYLSKGITTNSIQQVSCTSGGKGWKFSKYNSLVFTLENTFSSAADCGYEVGDWYSLICNYDSGCNFKIEYAGQIKKINFTNNKISIEVDKVYYPLENVVINSITGDERIFFVPEKPTIGDTVVGNNVTTFGTGNKNVGEASFVCGRDNKNSGQYSFIAGRSNIGGYGGFVSGRNNKGYANYSIIAGADNTVNINALKSCAFNQSNTVDHKYCFVAGYKNTTTADYQFVIGKQSNPSRDSLFTVNDNNASSQLFEVFSNGITRGIRIGGYPITLPYQNSLVIGSGNTCTKEYSLVGGASCYVSNSGSIAFGSGAINDGYCSYVFGDKVQTSKHRTFVIGTYNDDNSTAVFQIGGGSATLGRKNVFEVSSEGNVTTTGTVNCKSITTTENISCNSITINGNTIDGTIWEGGTY